MVCATTQEIRQDDRVTVDLINGRVTNETTGMTLPGEPLPAFLLDMLADGGLVPHLEKRLAPKRPASP